MENLSVIAALVRHGKYEQPEGVPSAHLPYALTPEGRASAHDLSDALLSIARDRKHVLDETIDTSRMLRAYETAAIVAERLFAGTGRKFTVEEFDALAERGLGAAANLTVSAIEAIVARDPRCAPLPPQWKYQSAFRLPFQGAETLLEAGLRVARHLEERLRGLDAGKPVLKVFVGHGGAFRHAAVHLGLLSPEAAPRLSMWHARPILLERLAEGRWAHVGGEWKVREGSAESAD